MGPSPGSEQPELFDAVFDALSARRGDHIDTITRHLLRHVDGATELIGITGRGDQAVCFDPLERAVYRIPISRHGVHVPSATVEWSNLADPSSYVDAHHDELDWIHPAYRDRASDDAGAWEYQPFRGIS